MYYIAVMWYKVMLKQHYKSLGCAEIKCWIKWFYYVFALKGYTWQVVGDFNHHQSFWPWYRPGYQFGIAKCGHIMR